MTLEWGIFLGAGFLIVSLFFYYLGKNLGYDEKKNQDIQTLLQQIHQKRDFDNLSDDELIRLHDPYE